ncbi:hypothetical protein KR026_001599 [Drosophila bipectinata]|nr:hypothetical protein KR026_001599 [Drosophila bipectinata]
MENKRDMADGEREFRKFLGKCGEFYSNNYTKENRNTHTHTHTYNHIHANIANDHAHANSHTHTHSHEHHVKSYALNNKSMQANTLVPTSHNGSGFSLNKGRYMPTSTNPFDTALPTVREASISTQLAATTASPMLPSLAVSTDNNSKRNLSASSSTITSASKRANPNCSPGKVQSVEVVNNFLANLKSFKDACVSLRENNYVATFSAPGGKRKVPSAPNSQSPPMATMQYNGSSPEVSATHQESALAVVHSSPKDLAKTPQCNVVFTDDSFPALPAPAKTPVFKSKFAQALYRDGLQKRNETASAATKPKDAAIDAIQSLPMTPIATTATHKPKTLSKQRYPPSLICANPLTQCHRCQGFGHMKADCRREFVCMKCAGSHPTFACSKPRHTAACCVNCKGQHISAYRGCPVYKDIKYKLYGSQFSVKSPNHRSGFAKYSQHSRPKANANHRPKHQQQRSSQGPSNNNNNYWNILRQSHSKMAERLASHPNSQHRRQDRRQDIKPNPFRSGNRANVSRTNAAKSKRANPAEKHLSKFQAKLKMEQSLKDTALTRKQFGRRQHNTSQQQQQQTLDQQSVDDLILLHKNTHTKLDHLEGLFNRLLHTLGKVTAMLEITDISFNNILSAAASGSVMSAEMQSLLGHDSFIDAIAANESIYV